MARVLSLLVVVVVALAPAPARAGQDKDKQDKKEPPKAEKIPFDKCPKAVQDAVKGRFPGAEVTSVEKETEDGKVVYDVELKHKGRKYEMDILENGTIIEIEKEIPMKDVPEAISKAVKRKYPTATIKEVMEVNKVMGKEEKPIHYEVTIEDPKVFTRPWKLSMMLYRHKEKNFQLLEHECYGFDYERYYP